MRRTRIIYSGLLITSLYLSYQYGNFFTSLITYSLIIVPVISFLYVMIIYKNFTYGQEIDKRFITKGEKIKFVFNVQNEDNFFYPDIEILFYGVESIFKKYFETKRVLIPPKSGKVYEYELNCKYRGYYSMGIKKIYIRDCLGLFRVPYRVFAPKYITVYPRIVPLTHFPIKYYTLDENETVLSQSIGQNAFTDIRAYQYGDRLKSIHWKLTAKKQQIMVKKDESTASNKIYILLDVSRNSSGIEENTIIEDQLVECTVAIIYYCLKLFIPIELIYVNHEPIHQGATDLSGFDAIYNSLFTLKFEGKLTLDEVLYLKRDISLNSNHIVLITAKLTYTLYEQIKNCTLAGSIVILVYVCSKEEKDIGQNKKVILNALLEIDVKYYVVGIGDDLEYVFRFNTSNTMYEL